MANFLQLVIAGLATGAIYALVAIGFTLLWQTSQTINFAQGEFVMLPAFFVLAALNLHAPLWGALLVGLGAAVLALYRVSEIYEAVVLLIIGLPRIALRPQPQPFEGGDRSRAALLTGR